MQLEKAAESWTERMQEAKRQFAKALKGNTLQQETNNLLWLGKIGKEKEEKKVLVGEEDY